jgi:hypothetical protein
VKQGLSDCKLLLDSACWPMFLLIKIDDLENGDAGQHYDGRRLETLYDFLRYSTFKGITKNENSANISANLLPDFTQRSLLGSAILQL